MTNNSKGSEPPNIPSKVPTDDSDNTTNVHRSDKQNNKLNNKLTTGDSDLALLVEAWPQLQLHEAIR